MFLLVATTHVTLCNNMILNCLQASARPMAGTLEGLKEAVDDLLKWCTAAAKHGHGLVSIGG